MAKGNIKHHGDGIRKMIVEVVMMTGCLPKHSLALLTGRGCKLASLQKKIKEMEQEGILREYKGEKKNGKERHWGNVINWTEETQDKLEPSVNAELLAYYKANAINDGYKVTSNNTEYTERLKIVKNAESLEFFYGMGYKAMIHEVSRKLESHGETYYTSKIFKASGTQALTSDVDSKKNISGTRMNGMISTQGGDLIVYNVDKRYIGNYSITGETKAVAYGNRVLAEYDRQIDGALILAKEGKIFETILVPPSKYFQMHITGLENVYNHIYAITLDETGQKMMRVMSRAGWQREMYSMILTPEKMNVSTVPVECDGYDPKTEQYIFVYCVPDIKRFKKFLRVAEIDNNREKYIVYCFDTQREIVMNVVGQYAKVYTAKFEVVYNHICEKENKLSG